MKKNAGRVASVLVFFCVQTASAAEPQGAANTAESLFQQGKDLLLKGDYEHACPLLEESYNLDRAGGALQNLALCLENAGKYASSYARWQELKSLSSKAKPPRVDRIELAEEHVTAITPKISKVFVEMPKENKVDGLKVTIDKIAYGAAAWGAGILLDPGEHDLEATATDRKPFATKLNVTHDHTTLRVNVPVLTEQLRPQVFDERQKSSRTLRTAGLVTGITGVTLAAAGGVFGVLAMTTNSKAEEVCPGTSTCPEFETANKKRDDARVFANLSNVLLPVGAVAFVAGAVLFWQGSKREPKRASAFQLVPGLGGISAIGAFQ